MPFPQSSDRRIAGHFPQPIKAVSHKDSARAYTMSGQDSFRPGVSATDNDHVEVSMFHVKHSLFAETEALKHGVQNRFHIDLSDQKIKATH